MAGAYYKPCKEFDICNELIEKYWESKQYDKCFEGHFLKERDTELKHALPASTIYRS